MASLFGVFFILGLVVGVQGVEQCRPDAVDIAFTMSRINAAGDARMAMEAIEQFTERFKIGTSIKESRVGFVLFDTDASLEFNLTTYATNAQVLSQIKSVQFAGNGGIDLVQGMDVTIRQVFSRSAKRQVQRMMILITDQTDNSNIKAERILADENGVQVFAIGVGSGADVNTLAVATGDARKVFFAASYANLAEVLEYICNQFFPTLPPPSADVHSPRSCECDYKKTWLDLVFLVDSSQAVSTQDFNGVRNFLASFARTIPVSQKIGAYSRITVINVGSEAHKIADLTDFEDSTAPAIAFRRMAHLKDKSVNMFEGLKEATNIIDNANLVNERKNVKKVIVLFTSNPISCAHYNQVNKMKKLKAVRTKVEEKDPCRIAAHLREAGNIVMTVGMKFDGVGRFPDVNVSSPCYSINYDTSMAAKFTQLMCKANCFCLQPYIQFKDDEQCLEYGECIYLQGTPLDFLSAKDTCSTYNTKLSDVHSIEKELFLQAEHTYVGYIPYWIGASKRNGVYTWETGTEISSADYKNWAPSQPNESAGECIVEKNDKFKQAWYSTDCSDFLTPNFFSCQKDACSTNNYCIFDA